MPDLDEILSAETPTTEETTVDEPVEEEGEESTESEESEPSEESQDEESAEGEQQTEGEQEDFYTSKAAKARREAIKEIKKALPQHAKLLDSIDFTNSAYRKFGRAADVQKLKEAVDAFGGLEQFTSVKDRLEALGGAGVLDELQSRNQQFTELESKYDAADPGYVDVIAKGNPEAFAKLGPMIIKRFGDDHPEIYNHTMAQVITNTLIQNGTFNNVAMLEAALTAGNTQQAADALKQIKQSLGGIQTMAQNAPAVRSTADPKRSEYETKLQEIQTERRTRLVTDIKNATNGWVGPEIEKNLSTFVKGKTITGAYKTSLDAAIKNHIGELLNNNAQFRSKRDAAFKRGDQEGVLRIYKQFATPLISQAVRKVARDFGLSAAAKKAAAATAQPGQHTTRSAEAGWEKVRDYPDPRDVRKDTRDIMGRSYEDLVAEDKFILKNGKKIQVVQ